jgi:hydroxymethylpyrimidine/phosphomethylpyrimidine kinase
MRRSRDCSARAFEREPAQQPWLWYEAWLRDPAGNAVCLFNAGENRRFPPWRLDSVSL